MLLLFAGLRHRQLRQNFLPEAENLRKTVEDRLGSLWYRLTKVHLNSLDLGTVQTKFEIPARAVRCAMSGHANHGQPNRRIE